MTFRVALPDYLGPLELLLYLVRRHELSVLDIPVAAIAEQYLEYLAKLERLDVDDVGEFLSLSSTLVEMKARTVLPGDEVEEEIAEDPRADLVRQLLEYKRFRDAAAALDERSRAWQERYPRRAVESASAAIDPADAPIRQVEVWDLVSAFERLLQEHRLAEESSIVYDDTPLHVFVARLHSRVRVQGQLAFSQVFEPGMHRSTLLGYFLAVLELARHGQIRVEQNELFGEIWLLEGERIKDDFSIEAA